MDAGVRIRSLQEKDAEPISAAFAAIGWDKPASQYHRYFADQESGRREAFAAFVDDEFAGYVTLVWRSDYPPFREADIPEIQDLNVLPRFRRRGVGSRLMDEAERAAVRRSSVAGIGVGVTEDYGAAHVRAARLRPRRTWTGVRRRPRSPRAATDGGR